MGRVFGFVATDLQSRINTIEKHMKGTKRESYETIQAMVAYETEEHLSSNSGSGSQNLLELHRALEFISEFMDKISVASDDAKTADIASEVYTYTLGTHHNWVVRKMAVVAMYTLPRRRELIEKMCKHDLEHVDSLLRDVVDAMMPVYSKTDKVLTEHHISWYYIAFDFFLYWYGLLDKSWADRHLADTISQRRTTVVGSVFLPGDLLIILRNVLFLYNHIVLSW